MSNHFVQHFLRSGDYVQTEFTCTAGEGANCRMVCKTCHDECRERCECGNSTFGIEREDRLPNLVDYGECGQIIWLNEDAPEEMYKGSRKPVRGPEPQAIILEWDGGSYGWDYAQ